MQNAPRELSAIRSIFIKPPFVFKTFVLSIFEWPLKEVLLYKHIVLLKWYRGQLCQTISLASKEHRSYAQETYAYVHGIRSAVLFLYLTAHLKPMSPTLLGRVAQSIMCLATDASLTADPGVASSIPARSHTFKEIYHEIISSVILLPSAESFRKGCCQLQAKVCARSTG